MENKRRLMTSNSFGTILNSSNLHELLNEVKYKETADIKGIRDTNYISFDGKLISYLELSKLNEEDIEKMEDEYGNDFDLSKLYKTKSKKIKPGRMFRRLLGKDLEQPQIESLLATLKTDDYYIEVVEGEQIRELYLADYYANKCGSLNSSCMRYDECQPFFDIYVNHARMAVLRKKGEEDDNIIHGRAILWDNVLHTRDRKVIKTVKVMDRIYSCTSKTGIFKKWAYENGYMPKKFQSYMHKELLVSEDEVYKVRRNDGENLEIHLGNSYSYYPYMDTFSNANYERDTLGIYYETGRLDIDFQCTEGNQEGEYCECCGDIVSSGTYIDGYGFVCDDCLEYGDFSFAEDIGEWIHADDSFYCDDCGYHFSLSNTSHFRVYHGNLGDHSYETYCADCLQRLIDNAEVLETEDGKYVFHDSAYIEVLVEDETIYFAKLEKAQEYIATYGGKIIE